MTKVLQGGLKEVFECLRGVKKAWLSVLDSDHLALQMGELCMVWDAW